MSLAEGVIRNSCEEFDTSPAPEVASLRDPEDLEFIYTDGAWKFLLSRMLRARSILPQLPEAVKNSQYHFPSYQGQ